MDLFAEKHPIITQLYYDYIQTEEYFANPLVIHIDKNASVALSKALEYIKNNDTVKASDVIYLSATDYELAGFILGFTQALKLFKETELLKENIQ